MARSATRCSIMRLDMTRAGPGHTKPSGYSCTETATPNSANCSRSHVARIHIFLIVFCSRCRGESEKWNEVPAPCTNKVEPPGESLIMTGEYQTSVTAS